MNSIEDAIEDEIDENAPIPGTVFNKRQARMLKHLVIVMGLMLIFGFVLMIGIIAYRASQPATTKAPIAPAGVSVPQSTTPAKVSMATVPNSVKMIKGLIPKGATFLSSTINGDRLILTLQTRDKSLKLVLIDLSSWRIVGEADLTAKE